MNFEPKFYSADVAIDLPMKDYFRYGGFVVMAGGDGSELLWGANDGNSYLLSFDVTDLVNRIDKLTSGFYAYPVAPTTQPSTVTVPAPSDTTVYVTNSSPHPLEPKVEKKCTCGAASCGHNAHSSWCDSLA